MSVTNLTANAAIQFHLRNAGVLQRAAGAVRRMHTQVRSMARNAGAPAGVGGATAGFAAYGFLNRQYEFENDRNGTSRYESRYHQIDA